MESDKQLSLFDFVNPAKSKLEQLPNDDDIKSLLKLGLLSIFTNTYEKSTDRIKAGGELGKMIGAYVVQQQSENNNKPLEYMTDDELLKIASGK